LHTEFGRVLAFLRDAPIPSALLTNGTLLHLPEVRASAALAQVVKISLSCWDQKSFEWVNPPHRQLRFETIFDGMKRFREKFDGQLWLEVFILSMIKRRPCTIKQIQAAFGLHINEISKALGRLMNQNRIRVHLRNRQVYYASR